MYSLQIGIDNKLYVVFYAEFERSMFDWLFIHMLGMRVACYGNYDNAFGYS